MATEGKEEYGPSGGIVSPAPAAERGKASVISLSPDGLNVIYTNGNTVIVRSLEDPTKSVVYSEHAHPVRVAKFSPSGYYVASGDTSGKVRVWAWNRADHLLKHETAALGGAVEDIAWGPESKRICAVGGGSTKARVFNWDTGSGLGEVIPLSKQANSCAMKPNRPYRAVWGGEDFELQFYSGPPFKYTCGLKEHTNFVNCVRYHPDGSVFVSVSSDKTAIVYDGKTAEIIGRLDAAGMHTGSVYHCAWSPDGSQLVTSGADKTLRIWDMSSYSLVKTITVGSAVGDMQVSVAWGAAGIVSLSLDGSLNLFDPAGGDAPTRVIRGHQAPVADFDFDSESGRCFSVCTAGRVCLWQPTTEDGSQFEGSVVPGEQHTKPGCAVAAAGGKVATAAWDHKLRITDAATGELTAMVAVGAQPRGVATSAAAPDVRVVVSVDLIKVFNADTQASETAAPFAPTCVTVSADGTQVAVGGEDNKVHFYTLADGALTAAGETEACGGAISCVSFAPDNETVAVGDSLREVFLFNAKTKERVTPARWQSHTTRVTGLAWRPSGSHLVSVSTDRRICIWSPAESSAVRKIDLATPSPMTKVRWQNETHFWTASKDGVLRRFEAMV